MTWVGLGFLAPGVGVLAAAGVFAFAGNLKGSERLIIPLAISGLGMFFFIAGAVMFTRAIRELRIRVTALRDGSPVAARVESITYSNITVNNRAYMHLNWSWRASGAKGEGQTPPLSPEHANRWRRGDPITAFRHPANPRFAEADVYGFRSVVPASRPRDLRG